VYILVINCGSSSLKAEILDHRTGDRVCTVKAERLGEPEPRLTIDGEAFALNTKAGHEVALSLSLPKMLAKLPAGQTLSAVGHRVVHGGETISAPVRIDDDIEAVIEEFSSLAPLHNPVNLVGIRAARQLLPNLPQVAVFDTAFHTTMPRRAKTYAVPRALAEKHKIRRYGFHGTSHSYVARLAADYLGDDVRNLRMITCHLGNGCSVAAIEHGRSVETSMGMTPLEGLVMGTRSGDVDPGVLLHLMRAEGLDADGLDNVLNKESGLLGISGVHNDMRDIEEHAAADDEHAQMAIHVFTHRLRKYIGAYAAIMGGVDAIVFTAGIGQNSALIRHRVAQRLDFLGARFDEDANRKVSLDHANPVAEISTRHSRCRLLVAATDEQHAIAQESARLILELDKVSSELTIPIAVSARHIHVTREALDILYGEGHELTFRKPLSQPGQFAAEETLSVVGPKRTLEGVRILGPIRPENQVEISRTDEFFLGVDAPVRASGDIENSPGVTLIGPKGKIDLTKGLICAWRHIHMTPEDADRFGVKDRDNVDVSIHSSGRNLTFGDVLVRVSSQYRLEMHIDTDEGNAAELEPGVVGSLAATAGTATLNRRKTSHHSFASNSVTSDVSDIVQ